MAKKKETPTIRVKKLGGEVTSQKVTSALSKRDEAIKRLNKKIEELEKQERSRKAAERTAQQQSASRRPPTVAEQLRERERIVRQAFPAVGELNPSQLSELAKELKLPDINPSPAEDRINRVRLRTGMTEDQIGSIWGNLQREIDETIKGTRVASSRDIQTRMAELNDLGFTTEADQLQKANTARLAQLEADAQRSVQKATGTSEINPQLATNLRDRIQVDPSQTSIDQVVEETITRQRQLESIATQRQRGGFLRGILPESPSSLLQQAESAALRGNIPQSSQLARSAGRRSTIARGGALGGLGLLAALVLPRLFGDQQQNQGLDANQLFMASQQAELQSDLALSDALRQSRLSSAQLKQSQSETEALNQMLRMLQIQQLQNQVAGPFI